ncbi:hypothetical protein CBR_g30305 [Chara braunii]|uniref:non-specific serine/threonine protein kinase n=1 Tax=Chara braunii TaxID=69332 RepID=A0A388JX15_CHABU|nr:hypothetical protein CBR_g30305 [Chara braunii]|eukprot:GBG62351.1 hypothetical protein CBR_g30305 [Chara braunii]
MLTSYSSRGVRLCRLCCVRRAVRTQQKWSGFAASVVYAEMLLCDEEHRLGRRGAQEIKAHPWFKNLDWDRLYETEAAFKPEVNSELDTQNFEKFEETLPASGKPQKIGPWRKMLSSKDVNFVGYTYKNFDIVQDAHAPLVDLKKKPKPKRPSINSVFDMRGAVSSSSNSSLSSLGNGGCPSSGSGIGSGAFMGQRIGTGSSVPMDISPPGSPVAGPRTLPHYTPQPLPTSR